MAISSSIRTVVSAEPPPSSDEERLQTWLAQQTAA